MSHELETMWFQSYSGYLEATRVLGEMADDPQFKHIIPKADRAELASAALQMLAKIKQHGGE